MLARGARKLQPTLHLVFGSQILRASLYDYITDMHGRLSLLFASPGGPYLPLIRMVAALRIFFLILAVLAIVMV